MRGGEVRQYAVIVAAAAALAGCANRIECVREGKRSIYTIDTSSKRWTHSYKTVDSCLEYRCKEGFRSGSTGIRPMTVPAVPTECLTEEEFQKGVRGKL